MKAIPTYYTYKIASSLDGVGYNPEQAWSWGIKDYNMSSGKEWLYADEEGIVRKHDNYFYYKSVRPTITVQIREKKEVSLKEGSIGDVEVNDKVIYGTYEQDNNAENGKEPIEWIVLDVKDGKALLMATKVLDCVQYNTEHTADIWWGDCSLRTWMNNDFYEVAFSEIEKNNIALSTLEWEEIGVQRKTEDKVFALSQDEMAKYFPFVFEGAYMKVEEDERLDIYATEYTLSRGVENVFNAPYIWLRNKVKNGWTSEIYVNLLHDKFIYIHEEESGIADSKTFGVCPAMWVNIVTE